MGWFVCRVTDREQPSLPSLQLKLMNNTPADNSPIWSHIG
jgi:hypothetical protein